MSSSHRDIRSYQGITPILGERVFVDRTAVVIGDVHLGDDCSVWPLAVIRGDMHHIRIGARTSVQDGSVLHITHASDYNPGGYPLIIGDDVTIGHQAMLHGCTIGDRVLVGMKSMIMDGAVVENEVIIAGAMVWKNAGKWLCLHGFTCQKGRPITEKERKYFTYTAKNYVKLKDKHMAEGLITEGYQSPL